MKPTQIRSFFRKHLKGPMVERGFTLTAGRAQAAFHKTGPDGLLFGFFVDPSRHWPRADVKICVTSQVLQPDIEVGRPEKWGSALRGAYLAPKTGVGRGQCWFDADEEGAQKLNRAVQEHALPFFEGLKSHQDLRPLLAPQVFMSRALLEAHLGNLSAAREIIEGESDRLLSISQAGEYPRTFDALGERGIWGAP